MQAIKKTLTFGLLCLACSCATLSYMKEKRMNPERLRTPLVHHELSSGVWVIAHRGASAEAPENTFPAFDLAVQQKAHMIEFDVQMTKDLVPVVIHDETLNRTTNGKGLVAEKTFSELSTLDAGSWKGEAFKGTKIPSLQEVLKRYSGKISMNIEVKEEILRYPGVPRDRIAEMILKTIEDADVLDQVVVSSFDHGIIDEFRKKNKKVVLGYLTDKDITFGPDELRGLLVDSWNARWDTLDGGIVADFVSRGIGVYAWGTNDSASELNEILDAGVSGIFTNKPAFLDGILSDRQKNRQ